MGAYLTDTEKKRIFEWVEGGAGAEGFSQVKLFIDKKCVRCHSPISGLGIVPLTSYAELKSVTNVDLGESIKTLARVSHVHLFGISFIFLSTGIIFSLSSMNKIRSGEWDPESNFSDRQQRDAMAAKGYALAFQSSLRILIQ